MYPKQNLKTVSNPDIQIYSSKIRIHLIKIKPFTSFFHFFILMVTALYFTTTKKHSLSIVKLQCVFSSCFVSFACHTHAAELLITNTPSSYLYWFTFVSLCPL